MVNDEYGLTGRKFHPLVLNNPLVWSQICINKSPTKPWFLVGFIGSLLPCASQLNSVYNLHIPIMRLIKLGICNMHQQNGDILTITLW